MKSRLLHNKLAMQYSSHSIICGVPFTIVVALNAMTLISPCTQGLPSHTTANRCSINSLINIQEHGPYRDCHGGGDGGGSGKTQYRRGGEKGASLDVGLRCVRKGYQRVLVYDVEKRASQGAVLRGVRKCSLITFTQYEAE